MEERWEGGRYKYTKSNFYTGLKRNSKKHFYALQYGRAAAEPEEVFAQRSSYKYRYHCNLYRVCARAINPVGTRISGQRQVKLYNKLYIPQF